MINYSEAIVWPDDESTDKDNTAQPLVPVSENTVKTITAAFRKLLPNPAGFQSQKGYSFPAVEDTKCLKLDLTIKQNLAKEIKDAHAVTAKLQTLHGLDVMATLVNILEAAQKGSLTVQSAVDWS